MAESRQVMLSDIQRRDQEIDRLRYELRGYQDRGYRGESRVAEGSMAGRRDDSRQQNRDSAGAATQEGYKVRTLKTRGTTAVLRVRPDEEKFAPSGEKSSRSKPATARSTARATADERTQDRGTGKSADNRQHAEKKPVDEKEFVTRGQLDTLARGDSGTLSIKDYQSLLEKKNTQVDQLQKHIKDLLALRRKETGAANVNDGVGDCLLYTSPSPRD